LGQINNNSNKISISRKEFETIYDKFEKLNYECENLDEMLKKINVVIILNFRRKMKLVEKTVVMNR
jgi:hypothetical protein